MRHYGVRFLNGVRHGAHTPVTYENYAASDTLALADTPPTFDNLTRVSDAISIDDFVSFVSTSFVIAETLAVEDLGGMLGTMALDDDVTLEDTGRSWVTFGSTMPTDAITLSDSVVARAPFAFADTVQLGDLGGVLGTFALDEEQLPIIDSGRSWIQSEGGGAIPTNDTLGIAEAASYTANFTGADTLGLAESASVIGTRLTSDTLALAESFTYGAVVSPTADALGITHGTPSYTASHTGADTLAIADAIAAMLGSLAAIADPLAIAEGWSYSAVASAINESLGLTDSGATYGASHVSADTLGLADTGASVTAGTNTSADTLGLADTGASVTAGTNASADTLATTDNGASVTAATNTSADTLAVADSGASVTAGTNASADTLAVADEAATWVGTIAASGDTLAIADGTATWENTGSSTQEANDTLGIADTGADYTASNTTADTLAVADGTATFIGTNAAADTLAIADNGGANTAASNASADTLAVADGTATWTGRIAAADTLAIADNGGANTAASNASADTLAIADGTATFIGTNAAADTLGIADNGGANTAASNATADTLAVADNGGANTAASNTTADTLAIADNGGANTAANNTTDDTLAIAHGTPTWEDDVGGTTEVDDTLAIADEFTYTASFAAADTLAIAHGTATFVGTVAAADSITLAEARTATEHVTHVATGTVQSAATGVTPGQPAGVTAGDLLVLLCETANEAVTTPTGWTIAPSSPQGTGTAAATTATRLSIFYRIATGSDAAVIADPGDHLIARIICYKSVNTTTPFAANNGNTAAASTSVTFPDITTTQPNQKVLLCLAQAFDNATAQAGAMSNANLTGITERIDDNTASGNGGGITLNEANKVVPGDIGSSTLTISNSVVQARIALALNAKTVTLAGDGSLAADVVAMLRFNGANGSTTIVDEVASNTWISNNGAAITTTSPINGSGSLDLASNTGTGDKTISTTNTPANFNFGTGDFTITFRARLTDNGQFWSDTFAITGGWFAGFRWNCREIHFDGNSFDIDSAVLNGSNHEIEFCKSSGTVYAFFDGTLKGTADFSGANWTTGTGITIGATTAGLLDEIRIIKGRALHTASYTANLAAELSGNP